MRLILLQPDTYTARQSNIADLISSPILKTANYQHLKIITLIFEFSYDKQEEHSMLISQFYAGRSILSHSDRGRPADYCSVYDSNAKHLWL